MELVYFVVLVGILAVKRPVRLVVVHRSVGWSPNILSRPGERNSDRRAMAVRSEKRGPKRPEAQRARGFARARAGAASTQEEFWTDYIRTKVFKIHEETFK